MSNQPWPLVAARPELHRQKVLGATSARALSVALIAVFAALTPASASAPVIIGANLKDYKRPVRRACTAIVPTDYATIQAAIDAVAAGSTVCVESGVYDGSVVVNKSVRLSGSGFADPSAMATINPTTGL